MSLAPYYRSTLEEYVKVAVRWPWPIKQREQIVVIDHRGLFV